MKAGTRTHTSDVTWTNSSGPNLGNRSGARSMALRMASKSIALLRMRGILAARAVAAIIPSNRQRANRSCRDSMSWWDRRGGEGGLREQCGDLTGYYGGGSVEHRNAP